MDDYLFSIECVTCQRRLAVRDASVIGCIVTCPKCGSMVHILPPDGWVPPDHAVPTATQGPVNPNPSGQATYANEGLNTASKTPFDQPGTRPVRDEAGGNLKDGSRAEAGARGVSKGKILPRATPLSAARPESPPTQSSVPGVPLPPPPPAAGLSPPSVSTVPPGATAEVMPPDPDIVDVQGTAGGLFRRVLMVGVPLLAIAAALCTWALLSVPKEPEDVAEQAEPSTESIAEGPSQAQPKSAVPNGLDTRWLPNQARCIACLHVAALADRPELGPIVAYFESIWRRSAGRILNAFRLFPRNVRKMTWASTDLRQWEDRAVVVLEFAPDQDAGVLSASGEALGWEVAGKPCRRLPRDWPHPFVVLDSQTMISGPEEILRELSERTEAAFQSEAIGQLVKSTSPEADVVLLVDLVAASEAGWPLPMALWDIWPAGRGPWRAIWETPKGAGFAVRASQPSPMELALVCDSESSAIKVRDAIGQFVPAARAALESAASGLGQRLKAGQLTGREADQYEGLLQEGAAALAAAKWELVEQTVILRADWGQHLFAVATAAVQCAPLVRADWLEAALAADQANQARLVESLAGYARAEKQFPVGAAGGSLLPAETRLSWIATMLPYFDRRDWHRELQFGYSWNSPRNRPVTQRPLEPVTNPALGPARTDAGFPVTHYVGVAGVGADAAELKTGDPRAGLFGTSRTVRPEDLPRGASNTLATLGVSRQLGPWAAGGNATVRALTTRPYVNGPDGFGSGQPHGMVAGMADGSARFISKNIDPEVLEQLATLGGGNTSVASRGPAPARGNPPAPPGATIRDRAPLVQPAATPNSASSRPEAPGRVPPSMTEEDDRGDASSAAAPDEDQASKVDVAARLADRIPEIHFPAVPLLDAMRLMSSMSTVPVSFDLDWLQASGVGLRDPVTARLTNATTGEVFAALAASRNLACEVLEDQVLVTVPAGRRNTLRPRKYDVADLTDQAKATGERLAAWVRTFVAPESWRESGGPGAVEFAGGALDVTQNDLVHAQVQDFLDRLRLARGKSPAGRPEAFHGRLSTRFDLARPKLRQPVTINFPEPTPLAAIVRELERVSQTTLLFDGVAMSAAGISRHREATVSSHGRPLSEALVSLLDPLALTYRMVNADTLEITTRKAAAARLEFEIYPLAAILARSMTPESVMERIKGQVSSGTWNDAGGPGVMVFDESSRALLVLQSQPAQVRIQLLLGKL